MWVTERQGLADGRALHHPHPEQASRERRRRHAEVPDQGDLHAQGIQGLIADSASGRRSDVTAAIKAAGGTVEAFYFCFGDDDVLAIADLPTMSPPAPLACPPPPPAPCGVA